MSDKAPPALVALLRAVDAYRRLPGLALRNLRGERRCVALTWDLADAIEAWIKAGKPGLEDEYE